MTLERESGREREREREGDMFGSKNKPGLSVSFGFLRTLKFAMGQQRVAEEQILSQLREFFTHLPEMCEYVWEIFTHL